MYSGCRIGSMENGIFTYMNGSFFMVNVPIYTSPMDPLGVNMQKKQVKYGKSTLEKWMEKPKKNRKNMKPPEYRV